MLQLLTAPETLTSPASAHRFMVELASNELVLDAQGIPVPNQFKTVDVCVMSPTLRRSPHYFRQPDIWMVGAS